MVLSRCSGPLGPALAVLCLLPLTLAFQAPINSNSALRSSFLGKPVSPSSLDARRTLVKEKTFDPMGIAQDYEENSSMQLSRRWERGEDTESTSSTTSSADPSLGRVLGAASLASAMAVLPAQSAQAAAVNNPSDFRPVCPASDEFYRFLEGGAESLVGAESAAEYGPLISGGLLRIRLELCVVESFFNEAVGPFIAKNGFSWILPLHETVETFIAGTVFALAATFILIGSTKIITVIVTYTDFLIGLPSRLFGGFFYDRALGKPVTLDIGLGPFKTRLVGPPAGSENSEVKLDLTQQSAANLAVLSISGFVKLVGLALKVAHELVDALDLFVGRYLVVWATGYVAIKFLHFKVFPDILDNPFDLSMF